MKLKHNEGWNIPFDCPFYPPLPAFYRSVKMHLVFFHAEARAIDHFLPAPLEPSESGLCVAGGIDVPYSSHYGAFQESLLLLGARFRDVAGFYCSHVFHNGPAGIAAGREIYGTPKVFAEVAVGSSGEEMVTETRFEGADVLVIRSLASLALAGEAMPPLTPAWRLKIIPRAVRPEPAVKQLIDCSRVTQDFVLHREARGTGEILLGKSARCDLTPLAPVAIVSAFHRECSYAEGFAEIAYDYLRESGG